MFPKPISWLGMEKRKITQQKHTFTNQETVPQHKINTEKLNPSLVASSDILPGNGEGFWFQRFINLLLTHPLTYSPGPTWGCQTAQTPGPQSSVGVTDAMTANTGHQQMAPEITLHWL